MKQTSEQTMKEAERAPVLEDSQRMPLVIEIPSLMWFCFKELILFVSASRMCQNVYWKFHEGRRDYVYFIYCYIPRA